MDVILVIGRVLFALMFVLGGAAHFQQRDAIVGAAKSMGGPAPEMLVPLSGAAIIAGGIMVALGLWADLGALFIIAFLVGITPIMHAFWKVTDPQEQQVQFAMFFKNLAMLGGAILIFYFYNQGQDVPASLTDALFGRI